MKRLLLFFIMLLVAFITMQGQQEVNGLHFDGTNDYVSLGNSSTLKPTDALTVEMWVKADNWAATGTHYLITSSASVGYYLAIIDGVLEAGVYRDGTYGTVTFNVSAYTGWHHVAMIFDGQYLYLYTDGVQRGTDDALAVYSIGYDTDPVVLGANVTGSANFFAGTLDEVRIWSTTRFISLSTTITEVLPTSTGLLAYYRCNQGTAGGDNTTISLLTDYTTNALDGTLYNFTLNGSTSNFVVGKALRPANQSTNVTFTNNQSNQITFSWTRPGSNKGGNGVKVFAKANATSGSAAPSDGVNYTANANFGSGDQIGTSGWYCVYDGTGTSTTVTGLSAGTAYRFHVTEYQTANGEIRYISSSVTGNPNTSYTLFPAPTTQASGVTFSNLNGTSFQVSWTRGDGSNCIVFVAETTTGTASPVDRTTYTANSNFGSGSQIGTSGWYCVYKGTGTSVTVTGLTPGNTYRVMVIEFNGVAGFETYLTTTASNNPNNQLADYTAPSTQASQVTFSAVNENSFQVSWTAGSGTNSIVFVKQTTTGSASPVDNTTYVANSIFGSGDQIGSSGWYCVYKGTGTSVTVTGLTVGQTYRVMVCSYNGISGLEKYNTSSATNNPANQTTDYQTPTTQASNISVSDITSNSYTISWTAGNGSSRAVFMYQGNTGAPTPVDNTTYTANSTFGSGDQIGSSGWYCVYNGTGSNVTVNGLAPATTYRIMVCEYNGTAGMEKYLTSTASNNPANATTDYAAPTTQATNVIFADVTDNAASVYITRGNGQYVAIFAAQSTTGTAAPVNNTTYTANAAFGSGDQIGSSGWYCIYNGTGNYVYLTNLQPATTYRIMACEYNGTPGSEKYNTNTASGNPANVETEPVPPTVQATNISFSSITTSSVTASWTRGNGEYCAAFIYFGSTGTASPVDNTTYTANPTYGQGSNIGTSGWYCVYNGTGNSVTINGLSANQTYRLMVIEYNGNAGHEKYNSGTATGNPANVTTSFAGPTTQATNITFSAITSSSFNISWTRGNGSACAVFAKVGASGSALPVDGTTYTANAAFGSGTQIGTSGWYCIYNGTGNNMTLTGLSANTSYVIMVCEYNGNSGSEQYNSNTATNNPRSQTTDFVAPTTQSSNVQFSNITSTSFTVSWTNGNGSQRVVFVMAGSSGSASPVDNTTYYANTVFGNGTQIGTSGWYCVYNGNGSAVTVTGLSPVTTYRVMVCEYNGTSGKQKYNTSTASNNPNNQTTATPPTFTQASNVSFSAISNSSFTLNWTRGNGTACAVFVANSGTGSAFPVDNTTYTANSVFGSGDQIGTSGWYCVYNGTGNTVSVTGLSSASIYRVMVCEYLGSSGSEQYNVNTNSTNPVSEVTTPSTTWSGSSWTNGTPDASTAAVIAANLTTSSNITCKTLFIKNNVTLSVSAGTQMTVGGDLVNDGTLRLLSPSDLSPAGSLITNGNIYNNKSMAVERYITPGTLAADNYVWHFISSPVAPFTVEKTFVGDYVYRFAENINNWQSLKTGDFIDPGKGYMVKTTKTGGKTLVFGGTFNTGSFSFSLTNTGGTADNGYNLVGNPYPSAIDWNAASGWTKTNLSTTIWIWNPTANNYATWNGFVGVNGGSRYIPAMQGFFVKVNEGSTSGTLGMTNSVRVHSSQSIMRKKSDDALNLIRLVGVDANNNADEIVVFRANSQYSSEKFFSMDPNIPQLFARADAKDYAIVAIDSSVARSTIGVGYVVPAAGDYQLKVSEFTFDTTLYNVYLTQRSSGRNYSVKLLQTIGLTATQPDTIWFDISIEKKSNTVTYRSLEETAAIAVWSYGNVIFVDLPVDQKAVVEIFNLLGAKLMAKDISRKGKYQFDVNQNGIYLVKISNERVLMVKKVFVKK
ncbi:MAG: LamG-like jellyroll fold domain-containing protein [Bacteroidales bacterium]